jgi:hypothetical protein
LVINGIVVGKIANKEDWTRFVEEKERDMRETLRRFAEEDEKAKRKK